MALAGTELVTIISRTARDAARRLLAWTSVLVENFGGTIAVVVSGEGGRLAP